MKQYVIGIVVASSGAAAVASSRYFIEKLSMNEAVAVGLSALIAVFAYRVLEVVFVLGPIRWSTTRRLLDARSRCEGTWVSRTRKDGVSYYNYITLGYDASEGSFSIAGLAFDSEAEYHSSWSGSDIRISVKDGTARFFYEASPLAQEAENFLGLAHITFQPLGRKFTAGTGYIVDTGAMSKKYPILFNRLEVSEEIGLLGARVATTNDEKQALIRKYREAHPEF